MYTKQIKFERYLPKHDIWTRETLRVTDDSLWIHLTALQINDNIRAIVVSNLTDSIA